MSGKCDSKWMPGGSFDWLLARYRKNMEIMNVYCVVRLLKREAESRVGVWVA